MVDELSDKQSLYRLIKSRDHRFDGQVFFGVKSTGIYCRPICSAKRPKFENCEFYSIAAQAEKNGYRPCLVCRPELAPNVTRLDAASDSSQTLLNRTIRRIEDGALNDKNIEALAGEFGVSGRYLRKLFQRSLGVSPTELAQSVRLLNTKQLLTETDLNITDVAFSAGFSSLRQFNDAFKKHYRLAPRDFRKSLKHRTTEKPGTQTLRIDYRGDMNWQSLCNFLRMRAIPGVEYIDADTYYRTAQIGDANGWLSVRPHEYKQRAGLRVTISDSLVPVAVKLMGKLKTLFDVRANVDEIESLLSVDPLLKPVVRAHRGMRLPGAFDGFELLLRAILGQQISVKAATTLSGRFAAKFGEPLVTPFSALSVSSPSASAIASASEKEIQALGVPQKRAETIKRAAMAVVSGEVSLSPGADPEACADALVTIPGIGEWTADYVSMRALAWPDAFPSGDLGVKKALGMTRRREILARASAWQPWRAYATLYLWMSLSD